VAKLLDNFVQVTGLTAGSWQSKNLSGAPWNVPATATGLLLVIRNPHASTAYGYGFRKPGSTDNRTAPIRAKAQYTAFPGCSGSVLNYYIENTAVEVWLAGYFEADAAFYDNGVLQTGYYDNQWTILDLSSTLPSTAKAIILEVVDTGSGNEIGFVPGTASPQELRNPIYNHQWVIVGLDASRRYDIYANSAYHTVHLVGYLVAGKFLPTFTDKTLTANDIFQDVDLTADGPPFKSVGAIVRVNWYRQGGPQTEKRFALRMKGSTDDWQTYHELHDQCWYPVKLDSGDIFQGKIDDFNLYQEFWLVGFLADALTGIIADTTTGLSASAPNALLMAPLEASPSLSAALDIDNVGAMEFSPMTMSGTGIVKMAVAAMEFPEMLMQGHGLVGQIGHGEMKMPLFIMTGTSGAIAVMQFSKMGMAGHGLVGQVGKGNLLFSHAVMDGSGHVSIIGTGRMLFSPIKMTGNGRVSVISDGAMRFLLPRMNAHGYAGIVGDGAMVFPLPVLSGAGFIEAIGRGAMDFPLPRMTGSGIEVPVTILYKGVAINASHFAITEYKDFPFNSFAYFNGQYLGANGNGIFVLGGNKDNGKDISASIELPPVDFGEGFIKRAREAWFTYRADGQLTLVIRLDEHETWESTLELAGARSHEERVKIARGIRNRFLGFGVRNEAGCDFDIESLRVLVDPIQRRNR